MSENKSGQIVNPKSRKLFLIGFIIGIAILFLLTYFKSSPPLAPVTDRARLVELLVLKKTPVAPIVSGYGRVEPKHVWKAMAEVTGKLIYRNPKLETGRILPKDTVLLKIDPLEYQLKLNKAQENINATEAQFTRIDEEEKNLKSNLEIETQKYKLIEQEYNRKLEISKKNLISTSSVEKEKQNLLAQEKLVKDLKSKILLIPNDRRVNRAQLAADRATLEDAERKLQQTTIALPFNARIGAVNIEQDQVVATGSEMLVAQQLGQVEIKAELSLKDIRILIGSLSGYSQEGKLPSFDKLGFTGRVELKLADMKRQWQASVTRVAETVNPDQATIGIYLEVEEDFKRFNPLVKPPLAKGMLVTAYITGKSVSHFQIPEKALHGDVIYLMDESNKLSIKKVTVLFRNEEGVVIQGDINEGDNLVTNDLIPAINGMALRESAKVNNQ